MRQHQIIALLIPAPSVLSWVNIEPVKWFCRASNISTTDPFCFSKKTGNDRSYLAILIYKYEELHPVYAKQKFHGNKGCHPAIITIKQGNQHDVPNRNPKYNQATTTTHYSFRHVHVLTKSGENTRDQYIYTCIYSRFCLIGRPVNRVSRLIGPNCEERNPIKDNALR